jgi:hypothetical protein
MAFAKSHTNATRRTDDISSSRAWKEQLAKQNKYLTFTDRQYVANPNAIVILAEDPNHVSFESRVPKKRTAQQENIAPVNPADAHLFATMERAQAVPTAKYKFPCTSNMEYGFFSSKTLIKEQTADQGGFSHALRSSPESRFSDAYSESWGSSPFHKTVSRSGPVSKTGK